ncbi:hypothetical protein SDC9_164509 [bioreactor metagenome]|uniref:Uncharacterized protein n=1 Tax=bioreactor metagenome TaxID=1076179 RepID=A0A645FUH5_9ZZZZ
MQRTHRLGAEVPALDDVVVQDIAEPLRGLLAVEAVLIVHQRGEHGGVAHLPADDARFDLGAAEVLAQLRHQRTLDLVDELRTLIVEHLVVVERRGLFVLRVTEARVAAAQQPHRARSGHFAGNQVDALLLPPDVVLRRFTKKTKRALRQVGRGFLLRFLRRVHDDGTGIRRRVRTQVPGGHHGGDAAAADVDLDGVVRQHVRIQQRKADGAHCPLVGKRLQ